MAPNPELVFAWPPPYQAGINPKDSGIRPGVVPPGDTMRRLATLVNTCATQRLKVVFRASIPYTDLYTSDAAADTWRFRFHASPNVRNVWCAWVFDRNVFGSTGTHSAYWQTDDGGGADNQDQIIIPDASNFPGQIVNNYYFYQKFTGITGDTAYNCTLKQQGGVRPICCTIWEEPKSRLDPTATNVVNPGGFVANQPIVKADLKSLLDVADTSWKTQGTHHFSWTVPSTTPKTQNGTTWVNVLDGAAAGWGASTTGHYTWGRYHGRTVLTSPTTEAIPVTVYAYLKTDSGGTAQIRFVDDVGTIATLTSTSTAGEWVSSNTTWNRTASTDAIKVDMEMNNNTVAKVTSVYAAGLYEYSA